MAITENQDKLDGARINFSATVSGSTDLTSYEGPSGTGTRLPYAVILIEQEIYLYTWRKFTWDGFIY